MEETKITEPIITKRKLSQGEISDLSSKDYHDDREYLSSSTFSEILKSPAHFLEKYTNREGFDDGNFYLEFGKALHMGILEGIEAMEKNSKFLPENFRLKPGESLSDYRDGKEIILRHSHSPSKIKNTRESLYGMINAVRNLSAIKNGQTEVSFFADIIKFKGRDPLNIKCKARSDIFVKHGNAITIIDVKTCQEGNLRSFTKSCQSYNYFFRMAFQKLVIESLGYSVTGLHVLSIEKFKPYVACLREIHPDTVEYEEEKVYDYLRKLIGCRGYK